MYVAAGFFWKSSWRKLEGAKVLGPWRIVCVGNLDKASHWKAVDGGLVWLCPLGAARAPTLRTQSVRLPAEQVPF